jgi:hypothetical protein
MLFEGAGSRLAGWLGLAAGFGLLGALCDQFHVQSGLLSYPDTWLWDQAAWVPLNFAVLLTGLVALTIPLGRLAAARAVPEPGPRRLAADFAVWVVRIAFREDRALLYPFGVALALAGCLVEAAEIEFGWFAYADPDVIGVPFWLAGIYLHGAPLALDVARRVDASGLLGKRGATA